MLRRTTVAKEPEKEPEVAFADITGTGLERPLLRCYVCNTFIIKGREISYKQGLAICYSCDDRHEEQSQKIGKLRRRAAIEDLPIEECVCHFCGKPIIDEKAIQKRLKRRTASGHISDHDVRKIESRLRESGYRKLGNGKYAHNRCG